VTEAQPLGSGGAIRQLGEHLTTPFFVLNGDIFTDFDLEAMARAHAAAEPEITIGLVRVDDPSQYGVIALDGADMITRFVEKPPPAEAPSDLVNAGIWLFEPAAVWQIPAEGFTMVEQDLFPRRASARRVLGHRMHGYWIDAGTPARYLQLHHDLLTGRCRPSLPLVETPGRPGLLRGTPLAPGGRNGGEPAIDEAGLIDGPCVLNDRVCVGERAAIAGPTSLGADVVLEAGAFVAESVLWDGCLVQRHAHVIASVLASGCIVGAGASVENSVLGDGVRVPAGVSLRGVSIDPGEVAA
jgi:mannose-1-phosphate guanylyltransferase